MPDDDNSLPVKEISLTPVITNLFKPSADMIGQELKDFLKEKIDNIKQRKKVENVAGHLKYVQENLKKSKRKSSVKEETLSQLEFFQEWVEGAQDVDPDEGIIAKLWQKILLDMARGTTPNKILIEKLKILKADEARELLRLRESPFKLIFGDKRTFYLNELKEKGLVTNLKIPWLIIGPIIFFTIFGFFGLMHIIDRDFLPIFFGMKYWSEETAVEINRLFLTSIITIMIGILGNQLKESRWKMSWIAKELMWKIKELEHPNNMEKSNKANSANTKSRAAD